MALFVEAVTAFLHGNASDAEDSMVRARLIMWIGAVHLNAF
eukprot:CAMPEP_0181341784 /NCGR_PEP_ID=MMETSP1101-20121128/30620_1 /TAXON_ID=46948 /ORGANISM="Rhodomonas abbreviata, Strain Caron Lab Isolate" /LENGTH=40 /DNA_ID= /DNA_START= /DNA_END= /DNA_ORIENTATION=